MSVIFYMNYLKVLEYIYIIESLIDYYINGNKIFTKILFLFI